MIDAIQRVMSDASFGERLSIVQQAIARTGGARRAADIIEQTAVGSGSGLRAH